VTGLPALRGSKPQSAAKERGRRRVTVPADLQVDTCHDLTEASGYRPYLALAAFHFAHLAR
jgi:hypothetical protein